ncbi:hypothetical protein MELB17_01515 [Marinobacter sp. ELB17]|nr:hypothetical protein MELB17_01515 [Marinobacter sp. ELB17]
MLAHVLSSLNPTHQLGRITTDAFRGDFNGLNYAIRIDQESSTVCQALAFTHHTKVVGDVAGLIANHVVLNLVDGFRAVVPGFVSEVGVCGYREHFNAHLLQFCILVSYVAQLGGAYESEISRVEEKYRPLAFYVCFGNLNELAPFESGCVKRFNFRINDTHKILPFACQMINGYLRL